MKNLLFLILILTACTTSTVTPPIVPDPQFVRTSALYKGMDILGLARQNVSMIRDNMESGQCIGTMAGTFGGILSPLETLLKTGKVPCTRVHVGGFCKHGAACGDGECKTTDLPCLKKKAKLVNDLAVKYGVKCFVSPYAEYSERSKARVDSWFKVIHAGAPDCTLVASPFGGYVPPGVLVEKHGNNPGVAHLTSNDGQTMFDSNSVKYNEYATVVSFTWVNRDNLRLTSEKGVPLPPKKRPLTNRLEKQDIIQRQLMQRPLTPRPAAPAVCKRVQELTGRELSKVRSEDYGAANDSRGNKPMYILKTRKARMDLLAPNGRVIGCTKYYGPYTERGYYRHYEGNCSGLTGVQLFAKAGGEHMFLRNGDTCYPVNNIRRTGYYR